MTSTTRISTNQSRLAVTVLVTLAALVATTFLGSADASAAHRPARHAAARVVHPPYGYLTRTLFADSFNRVVRRGWGKASVGGRYASFGSTGRTMTVGGTGYFLHVPSGHGREQRVSSVDADDLLYSTTLAVTRIPKRGNWAAYIGLEMREQSDGSAYTAVLHVMPRGKAQLLVGRRSPDGSTVQLMTRRLPRVHAGRAYRVQASIVGTHLWARAWPAHNHKAHWASVHDSSSRAITTPGAVGALLFAGGRHTSASARFLGMRLRVPARRITRVPPPPVTPPPVTTPPVTTPPVTTPPVTTPPVTTPPVTTPPVTTPPVTTPPVTSTPQHAAHVLATAGSAPVGSTNYPVPANAVFVATNGSDSGSGTIGSPFATVSKAIHSASAGSTIVLRGGDYNQNTFVGNNVDLTIQSYPGEAVWFDGSVPVGGWTRSGNDWVHNGWDPQFDHSASYSKGSNAGGFVNSSHPMAAWPDQVFVDGAQLQQVAANPSAGEFAVDYAAKQLIVGSDPAGHAVRASNLEQAFVVGGRLNLRGLGIRRYATPLWRIGTVYYGDTAGPSTFENLVIDDNATTGLATNNKADTINHVSVTNNGMTGMGVGHADGTIIENSLMAGNNIEHFNSDPSAGGLKVGRANGIVIKDNVARDNHDIAGLWTDENTVNFAITGNVVLDNGDSYGIENELSGTGVVANNTISGSKYGYTAFDSGDIDVYNNDVDNNRIWDIGLTQDNRYQPGKGTAGPNCQPYPGNPWLVRNVTVANNNFGDSPGAYQFYVLDKQTNRPANSMNLQVSGNQFAPRTGSGQPWAIGWGMGDNVTVHSYATANAFNSGEDKSWANLMGPVGAGQVTAASADAASLALPAAIANAIGQPVGTKHLGTF